MLIISVLSLSVAAQPVQTLEDFLQERALQQALRSQAQSHNANIAMPAEAHYPKHALAAQLELQLPQDTTLVPHTEGRRSLPNQRPANASSAKSSYPLVAQDIIGSYFLFNDLEINTMISSGRLSFEATTGHIQLQNGGSTFDWYIDSENVIVITPHKPNASQLS